MVFDAFSISMLILFVCVCLSSISLIVLQLDKKMLMRRLLQERAMLKSDLSIESIDQALQLYSVYGCDKIYPVSGNMLIEYSNKYFRTMNKFEKLLEENAKLKEELNQLKSLTIKGE